MITLKQVKDALEAAEKKATQLNARVSICVVDSSGILIASHRMDGAIAVSPDFAQTKAFTSATLGVPSSGLADFAVPGKPYFGVHAIMGGKITSIAGGQPIILDGKCVGGVGVGGSMDVNQDDEIARATIASFS